MQKLKKLALIGLAGLMGASMYGSVGYTQVPQPTVRLTTHPASQSLFPFQATSTALQTPVELTLQALDPAEQPLKNATLHLRLQTPPVNPWMPTDFPAVEGTELLNLAAIAPEGELKLQQMLPIRGHYTLEVTVTPTVPNAFVPFQQTLTLSVAEHPTKYRNFAILMVILVGVGVVGGWVIGMKPTTPTGEIAPQPVRLMLSGLTVAAIATLLVINISAEFAESHSHSHSHSHINHDAATGSHSHSPHDHGHDHNHDHAGTPHTHLSTPESAGLKVEILGDTDAEVGQSAGLGFQVTDAQTGQPVGNLPFTVQTTQLEDDWASFVYTGVLDDQGQFTWQQQFFDGAPHRLDIQLLPKVTAERQFLRSQTSRVIEVEGVAPPLGGRLQVLAYFTTVIALSLGLGYWLRQKVVKTSPT